MACALSLTAKKNYRPCVGILLLNHRNQVFVGRRLDTSVDAWQMPQGGIDDGEDVVAAAEREMAEEIGTNKASLLMQSRWWRSYDLPSAIAGKKWGGRYLGQTQRWCAYRFDGQDSEIGLGTSHAEFAEWRWIEPNRLAELIVSFKRDVYISVVDEFGHLWA